jgi:hypothetical protein
LFKYGVFSYNFAVVIDRLVGKISQAERSHVEFEVVTVVVMKSNVFWDITPL